MKGPRVIKVSPREATRAHTLFEVRPSKYGMGLFARQPLPAMTFVGTYPGVVMQEEQYLRLVGGSSRKRTKLDTYAVSFYKLTNDGTLDPDWVVVPGDAEGRLRPEFSNAVTPFVNEPTDKQANLVWVWNFAKGTVEMYTVAHVRKGQELFICYGGGYRRGYTSFCATKPNYLLHYKFADGARPATHPPAALAKLLAAFARSATPSNSLYRARSPSVNSTNRAPSLVSVDSASSASSANSPSRPSRPSPHANSRKRPHDNAPKTPPHKRQHVTMTRNAWQRDMRALLDKPRLKGQDVRAVHALQKMLPYLTNNAP